MKKSIFIITTFLLIGCSKEENEEQFNCDCETVIAPAQGFQANAFFSIRPCEVQGIKYETNLVNGFRMVKNATNKELSVISEAQNCN